METAKSRDFLWGFQDIAGRNCGLAFGAEGLSEGYWCLLG